MNSKKILLVGSILTERQYICSNIPKENQVATAVSRNSLISSKVINAGRMLSQYHYVDMLGAIGNDADGKMAHSELVSYGINPSLVSIDNNLSTGEVVVQLGKSGNPAITLFLGASTKFTIPLPKIIKKYDYIYLETSFDLNNLYLLISRCKQSGIKVFIDPPNQMAEIDKSKLKGVDFIVPNRQEAEELLNIKINTINDAFCAAQKLLSFTGTRGVITLDKDGCVVTDSKLQKPIHIPAQSTNIVDGSASGDIFRSVLLDQFIKTANLIESAQVAVSMATESIKYTGINKKIETIKEYYINLYPYKE